MRLHGQTLDRDGRGSYLKHGRWWWGAFRCEWAWKLEAKAGLRACLGDGDSDRELSVWLSTPFVSVYPSVELPRWFCERLLPYRWAEWKGERHKITEAREVEVRWDGTLWWSLWQSPHAWSAKTPRWRHGAFHPDDFLFGRARYSTEILEEVRAEIPMPEGIYMATVELVEASWKRPRWPFSKRLRRANVKPDKPIPVPGKGENSWDCGEDAIWESCMPARTVHEAVGAMVESAYRSRLNYGGRQWRPEAKEPA